MENSRMLAALAEAARALNSAGVVWALGGSALLFLEGVTDTFQDFDLVIAQEHIAAAQRAFEALGAFALPPAAPSGAYATAHFQEYTLHGVDFDLLGGFALRRRDTVFPYPFDETRIARFADVEGALIPLCSLADWYVLYLLMPGRAKRAALLAQHLKDNPSFNHRIWLNTWLRSRLPGDIRERVMKLYNAL